MKYLFFAFFLFFAVSAQAQITLEHSYNSLNGPYSGSQFDLVEVDSAIWKYVEYSVRASPDTLITISVFNLNHSLDRLITVPLIIPKQTNYAHLITIARNLFDQDGAYEYLYSYQYQDDLNNLHVGIKILREDGTSLFACDSCYLNYSSSSASIFEMPLAIRSTDSGVKMVILTSLLNGSSGENYEIYSLPGKLPSRQSKLAGVNPSTAYTNPTLPTSAYPNPSSSSVRITYELPSGVSSGDLILTAEDGREVKRYRVTSAFSDLLIESGDFPSGSYFYKVVTAKGESRVQKISLEK